MRDVDDWSHEIRRKSSPRGGGTISHITSHTGSQSRHWPGTA
jgi:hypothetical protein